MRRHLGGGSVGEDAHDPGTVARLARGARHRHERRGLALLERAPGAGTMLRPIMSAPAAIAAASPAASVMPQILSSGGPGVRGGIGPGRCRRARSHEGRHARA